MRALTGQVEKTVTRSAAQGAFKHSGSLAELISRPIPFTQKPLLHEQVALSEPQHQQWVADYHKIIADFEQFKHESSTFLFYQSIPLERRELSREEIHQWIDKMLPLHGKLLAFYLTTQQDAALKQALEYVEYAISVVDPYLVPALHLKKAQPKAAPFNLQNFLLYPPEGQPLQDPSITLDGKHIAVVNDNKSFLEYFETLSRVGVLLPGAVLHTQGDPVQFLLWLEYSKIQPDIIFTDIQLGENNGYYLVHKLRESGYTGAVIALTSYSETEQNAIQFKAAGFDGFVSLDPRYYGQVSVYKRITRAAQLYLEQHPK